MSSGSYTAETQVPMLALLIVTKNEADLLYWNLLHHLESGIDLIAVADNRSTDETRDVVAEFGSAVRYASFSHFSDRQTLRHTMLRSILDETAGRLQWAAICDTDEFFWSPTAGLRQLLAPTPDDIVAVNFNGKLFLPTELDAPAGPVFARLTYRTGRDDTPLHTSYREGKTFYRASWLASLPVSHNCSLHEHLCEEVPHPIFRHDESIVHHYMIQDEEQFVEKVVRLIEWARPPREPLGALRWRLTPRRKRQLPPKTSRFKKEWWRAYQEGGEAGVRAYYRTTYTIPGGRVPEYLADGSLVHDDAFARYAAGYLNRARSS